MDDDQLSKILMGWDKISWITKRRIDWLIIDAKYNINNKIIASVLAIATILLITVGYVKLIEQLLLFVSIILLKNIYGLMIDKFT